MEKEHVRFGLRPEVIDKLQRVFHRYPRVEQVLIYGSRAMGNYQPGSDIDLTLKGKYLKWNDLQSIELEIDELLLPYKVDLSLYNQIDNKALIEHIDRYGRDLELKNSPVRP
jgi:predicted nucleotidyltransferase